MTKRKSPPGIKPDAAVKVYWRDEARSADMFNAYLFGGEEVITPNKLRVSDTDISGIIEEGKVPRSISGARDTVMVAEPIERLCSTWSVLGMEHMTWVDYGMPFRVEGYDDSLYRQLFRAASKKWREQQEAEREQHQSKQSVSLSSLPRGTKIGGVITLVLYYGFNNTPWDADCRSVDLTGLSEEVAPSSMNAPVNLVELRNADLPLKNEDNKALFSLMRDISAMKDSVPDPDTAAKQQDTLERINKTIKALGPKSDVVAVVEAVTGRKYINALKKGQVEAVWTLEDELRSEGERRGEKKGEKKGEVKSLIRTALRLNVSDEQIVEWLMEDCNLSEQEAEHALAEYKAA